MTGPNVYSDIYDLLMNDPAGWEKDPSYPHMNHVKRGVSLWIGGGRLDLKIRSRSLSETRIPLRWKRKIWRAMKTRGDRMRLAGAIVEEELCEAGK